LELRSILLAGAVFIPPPDALIMNIVAVDLVSTIGRRPIS